MLALAGEMVGDGLDALAEVVVRDLREHVEDRLAHERHHQSLVPANQLLLGFAVIPFPREGVAAAEAAIAVELHEEPAEGGRVAAAEGET